jgi:hypothetical protein
MRRDSLDELTCAGELHRRETNPRPSEFELAREARRRSTQRGARSTFVGHELERTPRVLARVGDAAERDVILGELLVEESVLDARVVRPGDALLEGRRCLVRASKCAQRLADRVASNLARVGPGSSRSREASASSNASSAPAASPASSRDQPRLL